MNTNLKDKIILLSLGVIILVGACGLLMMNSLSSKELFALESFVALGLFLLMIIGRTILKSHHQVKAVSRKALNAVLVLLSLIIISHFLDIKLEKIEKILLGCWFILFSEFPEDLHFNSAIRFAGGMLIGIGLMELAQILQVTYWKWIMRIGESIVLFTFAYFIRLIIIRRRKNRS